MIKNTLNIISILLVFLLDCPGQQNNPFDIDTAKQIDNNIINQDSVEENRALLNNPFDVDHNRLSTSSKPDKIIPEKTIKEPTVNNPKAEPKVKREHVTVGKAGNFLFWLFGICLVILAVVINLRRKTFVNLYRSIFNDNYLNLMHREESGGGSVFFLLLYIVFLLNAAVFGYLSIKHLRFSSGFNVYLYVLGFLTIVYLIRHIAMGLLTNVFPFKKSGNQFNFTIIVFNAMLGIALFPVNVFFAYSPLQSTMFFLGLLIIVFFYSIRQLRGLFLAFRIPGLNLFQFFIYLCTCEIAPILIIIKLITNYNSSI